MIVEGTKTLGEIVQEIGKNDIPYIEQRIIYKIHGETYDEFSGICALKDGKLVSMDGDSYSLHDEFVKYEEWVAEQEDSPLKQGDACLTVWSMVEKD